MSDRYERTGGVAASIGGERFNVERTQQAGHCPGKGCHQRGWSLASPYTETISTGFFSSKDVTAYHYFFLGRQLDFGLIWGAATALVGVAVAFFLKPPYGKRDDRSISGFSGIYQSYSSRQSSKPKQAQYLSAAHLIATALGIGAIGFVFWLGAAFIAPLNDWGFGFDLGANMAWLGLLLGCVLGIGVGASLPIWWTAIRQWVQGRR